MRTYSRSIPTDTLKVLLARSGNQCAFPNCSHPLFNNDDLFIAQLCHIEAVAPNGQRHNPAKSDEETNSYDNLLFLCYRHHKETDDVDLYPIEKLKAIKTSHEARFKEAIYYYSDKAINALVQEANAYWDHIEEVHSSHVVPELAVPINPQSDILTLIAEVNENLVSLSNLNMDYMSDLKGTYFEFICLAMPNFLTSSSVALAQIEIKYMEELLLKTPNDLGLRAKLKMLRDDFEQTAQSAGLVD